MFLIGILLVCINLGLMRFSGVQFQRQFDGQIFKMTLISACVGLILGAFSLHTYSNDVFLLFMDLEHLKNLVISLEFWFCVTATLFYLSTLNKKGS